MTDESHDPFGFEPEPSPEEGSPSDEPRPTQTSTGIAWGAIFLLLVIALVVIFAAQNTDPVPVKFLWMDGEFSLAIVILITLGAMIVLTELIGLSYRKRRRRRRAEKEELKNLRGDS